MSRSRGWCFTLNNYTEDDFSCARALCKSADYGIIGLEIGKEGTQHLQGYIYKSNRYSFNTVKELIPRAHIESAKGSPQQNIKYCSKDGQFTEWGTRPEQGKRNDISEFRDAIWNNLSEEELLIEYPEMMAKYDRFYQRCRNVLLKKQAQKMEPPIVTVLVGEPGIGKTKSVYDNHDINDIYKMECGDGSSNSIWWDNYNGEQVILIDDFHNNFKLDYMLRLLDRYPMKLNIKGGHTWKCATHIYITSNTDPNNWYPNCNEIHRKAIKRRITTIKILQPQYAERTLHNKSTLLTDLNP